MKQKIPWNLIITCLSHKNSDKQTQELARWIATPENHALYERLSQLWAGIQNEAGTYVPDKDYYWRKLQAGMYKADESSSSGYKNSGRSKRQRMSSLFLRYAAVAAILSAIVIMGNAYRTMKESRNMAAQAVQFTNLNGKSQALLADGTKVWLHNNTSLDYRRLSLEGNREVSMKGEAFFEVSRDAKHPFVVQMEGVKLTVYGTKFNIHNMERDGKVEISLIEGSIGLETSRENRKMRPGETALFDRQTNTLQIENGNAGFDCLWAQKQLTFNQKPLGYICRYLAKWYNVKIELAPDLADKYLYTFTLRDEPIEEIMRLIAGVNPVCYQFDGENRLVITGKKRQEH